jgi:hypothetical protein
VSGERLPITKISQRNINFKDNNLQTNEDTLFSVPNQEDHACVPCLRRSGFAQAGETPGYTMCFGGRRHFGVQARVLPVGELVLWYGMFAPYGRLLGTTAFARGAP